MSYDKKTQENKNIQLVIKMLDGTFDPERDGPKKRGLPPPEQVKMIL